MSIYATTLSFDGEDHEDACASYVQTGPTVWQWSGLPCNCSARMQRPIAYRGSHVYPDPSPEARDGAVFDLGVIPGHIADGGGYDEAHEHSQIACHRPFLRVSFCDPFGGHYPDDDDAAPSNGTIILDATQVEELRDDLTDFLSRISGATCPADEPPTKGPQA